MKAGPVSLFLALAAVGIAGAVGGVWFVKWYGQKKEAREAVIVARMCAANAGPFVDRNDIDFDSARTTVVVSPASGEPLLYLGQKIERVRMLSLRNREPVYGCTMYFNAGSGQWAIVPYDYQNEMGLK